MLGFWRKKKTPTFWHPRKLMLCYQALRLKDQKTFSIYDFLLPFRFPISSTSSDCEAFRIFHCLLHLKAEGIKIKKIELDKKFIGIPEIPQQYQNSTYLKLYHHFLDLFEAGKPLSVSVSKYLKYLTPSYQTNSLVKDNSNMKYGSGNIWFDPGIPFSVQAFSLILPAFLSFELEINVKDLRKSLNTYVSDFREEKLTDPHNNYFGYSFTQKVFRALLDRLSFRQSKKSILNFRSSSKQKEIDEFKEVFQEVYPKEFNLWQKQTYLFPWWETLLALEQTSSIEIHELMSSKTSAAPQAKESNLHWHAIDQQPLQVALGFRIVPKESVEPGTETLEIIEVVKSDSDKYTVYLNENSLNPLFFSKKTKLGHLLYRIAEDGYIQYDKSMETTLEYVKDKRCKLWSKTPYVQKQVFEVDEDGYVIASLGISFRLLLK